MRVAVLIVTCALAGCVRDPVESICPEVGEGALVVTELRGTQSPDDAEGPWVELYNATSSPVDLAGTRIRFRRNDGSSEIPVLVRRALVVQPGEYTVLGMFTDGITPDHVDYGFALDYNASWLAAATIDVESCGVLIDRARYDSLPRMGSRSLATMPPDANANDLPESWCTDEMMSGAIYPGTPGEPNNACPP